ncbi:hypothetical protein EPI10_024296 [Gossypium australe]|uniref:Retrotransposon gag domain-containing protein n=1 Tax=Gossypium australe TaxID=47621 RepID=A0A5B6VX40_9ROSI|nr:hypothetical protein EPI10_024296 [Gossypium australe]
MISQLTQLLTEGLEKEKSIVVNSGDDSEDPTYPSSFTPINVQTQPEAYPRRVPVTIRPQQYQASISAPTNYPTGSGSNLGDNLTNPVVPDLDDMELPKQLEDRYRWLEEKFRAMENADYHCRIDAKDLSLVPDLVLPPKFKSPKFEKYNGTSCLEAHITMSAAKWYNQFSLAKINSWKDLTQAFMKQYSHVTDMIPDRITLQNMEKNQSESFRQYAQRWREVATQVQPPLLEKETTIFFINTLKAPFINHMLGSASKSFSNIVISGEMIENTVRSGKVDVGENAKRSAPRKRENEFDDPSGPNVEGNSLPSHSDKWVNAIIKNERPEGMRNYCEFHAKEGHEIQECIEFRALVKNLMDNKEIEFYEEKTARLESPVNEPVTEKEAKEFLIFLKHSEYSVVEQLHKQPTRISVLALLLSLETHRNALMKVLNETYVAEDIFVNKLDRLVNNISADNFIFFNDDEIPPGAWDLQRLCISPPAAKDIHCEGLPVDSSHMKTCQNIVRAFDGTERRVIGRIEMPLLIGSNTYKVYFLVMDIKPSCNCLLGKPWIHSARAVPSSLHQKLKLVTEGRLVTINAEEDIIASVTSDAPYIGVDDEAIECSFRSLEFVNATFIVEGNKIPIPKISKTTKMGLQLTIGKGALSGKGIEKYLQGRIEAPILRDKRDHFGII